MAFWKAMATTIMLVFLWYVMSRLLGTTESEMMDAMTFYGIFMLIVFAYERKYEKESRNA